MGSKAVSKITLRLTLTCLLLALAFGTVSCGGGNLNYHLEQQALYSQNTICLNIKNRKYDEVDFGTVSSRPIVFLTDKNLDLEKLSQAILKSNQGTTTELTEKGLWIKKESDHGTNDYFYISERGDEPIAGDKITDKNAYWITSMFAGLYNNDGLSLAILFPVFVINDSPSSQLQNPIIGIENAKSYEIDINYTLEDFYDFYQNSGYFDVSKELDAVILKNIPDPNIPASGYVFKGNKIFDYQIRITVENREKKKFLTYEIVQLPEVMNK